MTWTYMTMTDPDVTPAEIAKANGYDRSAFYDLEGLRVLLDHHDPRRRIDRRSERYGGILSADAARDRAWWALRLAARELSDVHRRMTAWIRTAHDQRSGAPGATLATRVRGEVDPAWDPLALFRRCYDRGVADADQGPYSRPSPREAVEAVVREYLEEDEPGLPSAP